MRALRARLWPSSASSATASRRRVSSARLRCCWASRVGCRRRGRTSRNRSRSASELGDRVAEGEALNNLGCLYHDQGRLDEARSAYEEALAMHREVGNRRFEGYALGDLGRLQRRAAPLRRSAGVARAVARDRARDRATGASRVPSCETWASSCCCKATRTTRRGRRSAKPRRCCAKSATSTTSRLVLCGRGELERRAGDLAVGARVLRRGAAPRRRDPRRSRTRSSAAGSPRWRRRWRDPAAGPAIPRSARGPSDATRGEWIVPTCAGFLATCGTVPSTS